MKLNTKRSLIFSGLFVLSSSPVVALATTLVTTQPNLKSPNINSPYTLNLNGREIKFDSVTSAANYLTDIYAPKFYSSSISTNQQYFNSINDLMNFISSNENIKIEEKTLKTTQKLTKSTDLDNELIRIPEESLSKTTTIYKNAFGGFSSSWEEAVSTFNQHKQMYYFNGIYFNSLEDLEDYLRKIYYLNENSQGFQEQTSTFYKFKNSDIFFKKSDLESDDIKSTDFYKSVVSQSTPLLKIENDYISLADLDNQHFNEPIFNYTTLDANNGESIYLIDVQSDSPAELIGPRYVKSDGTIKLITDPNNWFATNLEDIQQTTSKFQQVSNLFFDLFILKTSDYPISIIGNESAAKEFYNKLKTSNLYSYNELEKFVNKLDQAKSTTSFEKIQLSYHFLIQNLIEQRASEDLISATKQYFQNCLKAIDKIIYTIFPHSLLKHDVNGEIFSLAKSFNFASSTYNFNVQNNYLSTLIDKYSYFKAAIIATITGLNNESNSFIDYESLDEETKELFKSAKFNEMKEIAQAVDVELPFDQFDDLLQVYNFFSSNSFDQAHQYVEFDNELANEIIRELKSVPDLISEIGFSTAENVGNLIQSLIDLEGIDRDKVKEIFTLSDAHLALIQQEEYKKTGRVSASATESIKNILVSNVSSAAHKINPLKLLNRANSYDLVNVENKYKFNAQNLIEEANSLEFSSNKNQSGSDLSTSSQSKNKSIISSIFEKIGTASEIIDTAFTIASFIRDAFVPSIETKIYQFQTTDQTFYWTGGYEKTLFFGLINLDSSTPKDIKFITPTEIIKPQLKTQYYFDKRTFDTLNDLIKYQVKLLKNLIITEPHLLPQNQIFYQFNDDPTIYESIDNLISDVKNKIVSGTIPLETYWSDDGYKLSSSQFDLVNTRIEQIKKEVYKNQKFLIIPIPKSTNQIIDYNDLSSFAPTSIYTIEDGLKNSLAEYDYIVKNYSELEQEALEQGISIDKLINDLLQSQPFFKNLDSKIINNFVFSNSTNKTFDEIDEVIYETKIYQYHFFNEKTQKVEIHQFLTKDEMFNSLINKLEIKSTKDPEHEKVIFYKNQKYTYDELVNYLLKN